MSNKQHPNPNDQRSNVKNPNSAAFQSDRQNRLEQGHRPVPPPAPVVPPAPKK
jgi:hypothetical protein